MSIDHIIERIRSYRHTRGWSILRFAKEAGMGESTIRNMDRSDWSPTADTIRRLEAVIPPEWVRPISNPNISQKGSQPSA